MQQKMKPLSVQPDTSQISDPHLLELGPNDFSAMSPEEFMEASQQILRLSEIDRQENALLYYEPVSDKARLLHETEKRIVCVGGGNGASKTELILSEMMICATGVIPESLRDIDWKGHPYKCTGPQNLRIICESITTTLYNVILPKLQWWKWTGLLPVAGDKGHFGWIPRRCLIDGQWDRSWSDKHRTLRVLCFDPDSPTRLLGESTVQFMSHDQDSSDFASGDFHKIHHDEPPKYATWRESQARTMRVLGRLFVGMTWPDDPAIPVDWIFDELYEPAESGHPEIEWINLYTTDNKFLDQTAVSKQMAQWSPEIAQVRIYGKPIRHANRVHPDFTDRPDLWCFSCQKPTFAQDGACHCGSRDLEGFCHVRETDIQEHWPVIFLLDPHPRKPHMGAWYACDPADDLWGIDEILVDGSPLEVREQVELREIEHRMRVVQRLMDPNMGRSPSQAVMRETTWQDEFWKVGLSLDLADDGDAGRKVLNDYLKPDRRTRAPRICWNPRCKTTILQMKRYVWDEYKASLEKDLKQTPRAKNDDFPTMAKYLMNSLPSYRRLTMGDVIQHRLPSLRGRETARIARG